MAGGIPRAAALRPGALLGDYPECGPDVAVDSRDSPVSIAGRVDARSLARFAADVRRTCRDEGPDNRRASATKLRRAFAREGFSEALLIRAFALTRDAARDALGIAHRDTQLMAGRVMMGRALAEMQTGEGKTLAATLPACAAAMAGVPVHVITANDYLASRDATAMGPVYRALGLSVGSVTSRTPAEQRRAAYRRDVTYTTSKQLAFDYLRDRIMMRGRQGHLRLGAEALHSDSATVSRLTLRGLCFAIIDEADSVLIDEASTPFVIARETDAGQLESECRAALHASCALAEGRDFETDTRTRRISLTAQGRARCDDAGAALAGSRAEREAMIVQALAARHVYQADRDYLVRDGEVQIIDPNTGRVLPDRSWERGLHQMIECKEACEVTAPRETLASLTFQRLFPRYLALAGMTGTASEVAGELRASYGLRVVRIPTHRPCVRRVLSDAHFADQSAKFDAIIDEVRAMQAIGRPVLVGTRTVDQSEQLSKRLADAGLPHEVLNARQDAREAAIISRAGQRGAITVATNMAGRGTDILLGDGVAEAGGLHVIVGAPNDAGRLDRQLVGRCSRQGEPGSCRRYVSSEDDIMRRYCPATLRRLATRTGLMSTLAVRVAQRRCELHQRSARRHLRTIEDSYDRLLALAGRRD